MSWQILQGEALARLREMPDESVQTVVTSPPYWGLRDYGTGSWEGGDPDCDHEPIGGRGSYGLESGESAFKGEGLQGGGNRAHVQGAPHRGGTSNVCRHCGAKKADDQLGLEPTPDKFVERMVVIFREVRRVLRKDGTCWLNLGDSFASRAMPGLKAKDLVGMPWMVAFALRADGWHLRSDIIWNKPNPMPESVSDRPTRAHEYLFLLTKGDRYFYDQDAIREAQSPETLARYEYGFNRVGKGIQENGASHTKGQGADGGEINPNVGGRNKRSVWTVTTEGFSEAHFATYPTKLVEPCILAGSSPRACTECGAPWVRVTEETEEYARIKADLRDRLGPDLHMRHAGDSSKNPERGGVDGQPGTHPATLPEPRRTIGWRPSCTCAMPEGMLPDDLETIQTPLGSRNGPDPSMQTGRAGMNRPRSEGEGTRPITRYQQRLYAAQLKASPHREQMKAMAGKEAFAHYLRTDRIGARPIPPELLETWMTAKGWLTRVDPPEVDYPSEWAKCVVLDPFTGSGTTAVVALRHDRSFVGIELNAKYVEIARNRICDDAPLFNAPLEAQPEVSV
jgi:DNA modification methylase